MTGAHMGGAPHLLPCPEQMDPTTKGMTSE